MTKSFPKDPVERVPKNAKRRANGHGLQSEDRVGAADADEVFVPVDDHEDTVLDLDEEERADEHGDDAEVDATDDPVRMYLMQMGAIPLLNRFEEVSAAQQIERTRRRFRHCMLATDYVLQGAVEALELVRDSKLRLDRTIEVPPVTCPSLIRRWMFDRD